ncbi:uncharacterized protein LOC143885045 isoform X2 [Tasmannia lanceolata]|uniref:uncharacterized protein LOC143885045 isoform X2 n=1 Tax=Tasmannia lanceolata TaxID=3420 RepID=UPI00406288EF
MDLETENRIAAILMQEATKMRLQAEKEGVHVYLQQPKVRGRPNSRFLTATVLGVQQANRAVEVNEMWRVRKKELELDDRLMGRSRDKSHRHHGNASESSPRGEEASKDAAGSCTSSKRGNEDYFSGEVGGLRDDEVEEFLHSRVKRGRGAIGSRMDEPGPYLLPPSLSDSKGKFLVNSDMRVVEEWEQHVIGPEKASFLKSHQPAEESMLAHDRNKVKKVDAEKSKKHHSKDGHRSKVDESREKKKREKKSKHRHSR